MGKLEDSPLKITFLGSALQGWINKKITGKTITI